MQQPWLMDSLFNNRMFLAFNKLYTFLMKSFDYHFPLLLRKSALVYVICFHLFISYFYQLQKQLYNHQCLSVCPSSVQPSEIKTPQPLRIKPIWHYAYLSISQTPISHHISQPPCIMHNTISNQPTILSHYAYLPSCSSSIRSLKILNCSISCSVLFAKF